MSLNILHTIFFDESKNWEKFKKKFHGKIRPVALREVKKFKDCGDLKNGFKVFVCDGCKKVKRVPLRCKGKFCPTCSIGESQRWSDVMAQDMFSVVHRHVIFTIDEGLRKIFAYPQYRTTLLKGLMDEAAGIIQQFFKKRNLECGIVAALHTFGSKLEFNPHVHMVVTMGGVTQVGEWQTYDYLPFPMLRKFWQNAVLKLIRRTLTPRDKKTVQPLLQKAYNSNDNGFYVNAPKRARTDVKKVLQYISRYMNRGPISKERIEFYDGNKVIFRYKDKRTNQTARHEMTSQEFIGNLIRHIPDAQFKTIRRYGIYSRRMKTLMKKIVGSFQKQIRKLIVNVKSMTKPMNWSERMTECFGEDPLECTDCGGRFEYSGMIALKNGKLVVQYAKDEYMNWWLKEEIKEIESKEWQLKQEKKRQEVLKRIRENSIDTNRYLCLS
jgi:hypothetical protein